MTGMRWGLGRHQQCVLPPTLGLGLGLAAGAGGEGWMGMLRVGEGLGPSTVWTRWTWLPLTLGEAESAEES